MDYYSLIIGGVIILVLGLVFNKYKSALFLDLLDLVLSFLDNFLAGAGLAGFDIGDLVAAIIIYSHEKKYVGKKWALFVAWEALNFLPLGLIPVFGEVLETILGFVPTVFIVRLLFSKQGKAEKLDSNLEKEEDLLEKDGLNVSKKNKNKIKDLKSLTKNNPIQAIREAKKISKNMEKEMAKEFDKLMFENEKLYDYLSSQEIPFEAQEFVFRALNYADSLQSEFSKAQSKKDYNHLLALAKSLETTLRDAAVNLNNILRNYGEV